MAFCADKIGRWLLAALTVTVGCATNYAQGPCGGKPCPVIRLGGGTTEAKPRKPRPVRSASVEVRPAQPKPHITPTCGESDLVVVCGMPGCEITINGKDRNITDELGGITFQVPGNRSYKVRITKPGYEAFDETVKKLDCDAEQEVKARLRALPVTLRVRTKPVACDIYVDGQKQTTGSDSQGTFSYLMSKPTILLEARKKGYLSATKNIFLAPELAAREISLDLEPISSSLMLVANITNARVTVDDQKTTKPITERIILPPGSHTVMVDALGYAPAKLDLTVGTDESLKREVTLERLPITSLQAQATTLMATRAYDDVLKLAAYMLEADKTNPNAHRLIGLVFVERGDFANATSHLEQALPGGETVPLRVRRHPGEKFELNRGHDLCDAQLVLGKSQIEFIGLRNPVDNFKVTYDQVQVIGIQLKNNVASYLSTKISVGGKRRDFNFYSYDKELSQSGKPYLEMIQRLLRSH